MALIILSVPEREVLALMARRNNFNQQIAQRARIILECAEGLSKTEIARKEAVPPRAVVKWLRLFAKRRVLGLLDVPFRGTGRDFVRSNRISNGVRNSDNPGHLELEDLYEQHESATTNWLRAHILVTPAQKLPDPVTVFTKVKEAANDGDAEAQYILGLCYSDGFGTDPDPVAALHWLRRAADNQNASAQCTLGYLYWLGFTVPQDRAKAVHWFRTAAQNGNIRARDALSSAALALGREVRTL